MNDAFQDQDRGALLNDALMALEEMQARLDTLTRSRNEPIAIVGLSCRFPGGANDPDKFWSLLQRGGDAIQEVPKDRWDVDAFYDPDPDAPGKTNIRFGAFIDQVDQFDSQFFGISPREANGIDPQQRLVLEVSWEALEAASMATRKLRDSRTGVFIGIGSTDFAHIQTRFGDMSHIDAYTGSGSGICFAAGRLSYTLGLQGPSISLDTACSSSLVTLHLACQSLRLGECDLALAGGVHLMLSPDISIYLSKIKAVAIDGRSKTFDAAADGFSRGEGCGMVVLKRLSDAERDGDNILALILGSAVNQDGASSGLTAPNGSAQQKVIRQALSNAEVDAQQVSYIEAHGTGTILGDPIEMGALVATYGRGRPGNRPLVVGSVKTNIGHLEAAAGIAGLIKVVLSLQHDEIPPHLHFNELNPHISLDDTPIVIPVEGVDWPSGDNGKMAAVSSFGLSGTNVHVILGEPPEPEHTPPQTDRSHQLLCLSADSEAALEQLAQGYARHLSVHPEVSLADTCFNANAGRSHFEHRLALVAESSAQACNRLEEYTAGKQAAGIIRGFTSKTDRPKVVFLFTGQGSQYVNMGRQLYDTQVTFRKILEQCNEGLRTYLDQPLLSVLYPDPSSSSPLDQTAYTQPALFALEYALAALWRSWGIEPAAVMGHSVGEYVAACVAGVFSLEDGLALIAKRGRYMHDLPQDGKMAVVFAEIARVEAAIAPYADKVSIAAVNGPENIVISGQGSAIIAIVEALEIQGVASRQLNVSHAFHSPLMEPILDDYGQTASQFRFHTPGIPLISNLTGQELGYNEIPDAAYWRRHIRQPVQFSSAIETLHTQGFNLFLEIGPSPTLSGMAQRCLPKDSGDWLPSLRRGQDDWEQMLQSLAKLYTRGVRVDWQAFDQDYSRSYLSLPTYPFQRERHWVDHKSNLPETSRAQRPRASQLKLPLVGSRLDLAGISGTSIWQGELDLERFDFLKDHKIQGLVIFPATAYMEMVMEAARELFGEVPLVLSEIQNKKVLILHDEAPMMTQLVMSDQGGGDYAFEVYSSPNGVDSSELMAGSWTLHVTGKLSIADRDAGVQALQRLDLDQIRTRCQDELAGSEFYQASIKKGNQWGPAFQGTERIWLGEGEALSSVRVLNALEAQVEFYQFHPAVADSSGHLLAAMTLPGQQGSGKSGVFVGGGIEEIRFHRRPRGSQFWAYARLRQDVGEEENVLVGDVQMIDESGEIVVETLGVRFWYLDHDPQSALLADKHDWFYELEWFPTPRRESKTERPANQGAWLIFSDGKGIGAALAERLAAEGAKCILVSHGDQYQQQDELHFRLRPDRLEDMQQLLKEIGASENPLAGVFHLWSLDAANPEEMSIASLESAQTLNCASVLLFLQAAVQQQDCTPAPLWLVTQDSQAVVIGDSSSALVQAPLWGFGRTLASEHSEFWGGLVDLPAHTSPGEASEILEEEITSPDGEDQIAFRAGQRYAVRLVRMQRAALGGPAFQLRSDASYLITGGLGGLGLRVARWMIAKGARHLILLGRTQIPPRASWEQIEQDTLLVSKVIAIQELEALGAHVHLASVDLGDESQLQAFLDGYSHENHPPIRGIVHAAGIMQYQSLLEHDLESMQAIMRPKIIGGWLLHHSLRDASLDFFVSFSSAASILNSPLTGSYAAANAYLDALAHYRKARGLHALSINWGPWIEVGMAEQFESREADASYRAIAPIDPQQGVEALEILLGEGRTQVGVMPINWELWEQLYPASSQSRMLSHITGAQVDASEGSDELKLTPEMMISLGPLERQERLEIYLGEQAAMVLGLSKPTIDLRKPLTSFGFDSLMAIELKNRIENDLHIVVPMVEFLQGPDVTQLASSVLDKLATEGAAPVPGAEGLVQEPQESEWESGLL